MFVGSPSAIEKPLSLSSKTKVGDETEFTEDALRGSSLVPTGILNGDDECHALHMSPQAIHSQAGKAESDGLPTYASVEKSTTPIGRLLSNLNGGLASAPPKVGFGFPRYYALRIEDLPRDLTPREFLCTFLFATNVVSVELNPVSVDNEVAHGLAVFSSRDAAASARDTLLSSDVYSACSMIILDNYRKGSQTNLSDETEGSESSVSFNRLSRNHSPTRPLLGNRDLFRRSSNHVSASMPTANHSESAYRHSKTPLGDSTFQAPNNGGSLQSDRLWSSFPVSYPLTLANVLAKDEVGSPTWSPTPSKSSTNLRQDGVPPILRFNSLSINTNVARNYLSSEKGYSAHTQNSSAQSPHPRVFSANSAFSTTSPPPLTPSTSRDYPFSASTISPSTPFSAYSSSHGIHQRIPASTPTNTNPADQNPPCNTIYVGNLPPSTSEEELKVLFSTQVGYKRLCFRTKGNGPMCFVEFENIPYAMEALKNLQGVCLSSSIKGGIRLSFSKNPLGVRSSSSSHNNHNGNVRNLHSGSMNNYNTDSLLNHTGGHNEVHASPSWGNNLMYGK